MREPFPESGAVAVQKKKPNWVARVFLILGVFLGIMLLSSCTKSFMSDADQTNIMYSYFYGQDSTRYELTHDDDAENDPDEDNPLGNADSVYSSIASQGIARPSLDFQHYALYASYDYDEVLNKTAADEGFLIESWPSPILTDYGTHTDAMSAPQTWIQTNLIQETDDAVRRDRFGDTVIDGITPERYIEADSYEEALTYYIDCFQSVKAMAIFGGFDENGDVALWANFEDNYIAAQDPSILGFASLPIGGFVNSFQSTLNSAASANRAGLNTSGQGGMYGQPGEKIYITAKSWGEAFSKYGFFEGLLVWPFGWLVNSMSTAFASLGHGWAEFCAIMLMTLTVRAVLLVLSIFANRSQTRLNDIQPQIAALQSKYPNSETNREDKMALARETSALYKKAGVKPWISIVMLIVQFPLFICVWSALEGSAVLASGNFYGITLTETMMNAMTGYSGGTQALAIFLFIFMTAAQIFSSQLPMWFQNWRSKRFTVSSVKVNTENKSTKVMKYVSWGMTIFVVLMGFTLPVAMSIYWYFGAMMSLAQTLITELINRHNRHKHMKDGDSLAAIRRSAHHNDGIGSLRRSRAK